MVKKEQEALELAINMILEIAHGAPQGELKKLFSTLRRADKQGGTMDKKEQEALELAINLILEAADELQTIKMLEE